MINFLRKNFLENVEFVLAVHMACFFLFCFVLNQQQNEILSQ